MFYNYHQQIKRNDSFILCEIQLWTENIYEKLCLCKWANDHMYSGITILKCWWQCQRALQNWYSLTMYAQHFMVGFYNLKLTLCLHTWTVTLVFYRERCSCIFYLWRAMTEHHDVNCGYLLDTLLVSESVNTYNKHITCRIRQNRWWVKDKGNT